MVVLISKILRQAKELTKLKALSSLRTKFYKTDHSALVTNAPAIADCAVPRQSSNPTLLLRWCEAQLAFYSSLTFLLSAFAFCFHWAIQYVRIILKG